MRCVTILPDRPNIFRSPYHDLIRVVLLILGIIAAALWLFGCLSTGAHWDSETVKPDGTVIRTSRGYSHQDSRQFADVAGDTAGGLSQFLNDSGLSGSNPIIGGIAGILGLAGGILSERRVKKAEDRGWDTSRRENQPVVVLGPPTGSVPGGPSIQTPLSS